MVRILAIDIGAGTQDILVYDTSVQERFKLVAKSPTRILAERILSADKDLVITGDTMGGGPVSQAIKQQAKQRTVYMTPSAAATIHHDRVRIESLGIRIINDGEAKEKLKNISAQHFILGDIFPDQLKIIFAHMGIGFAFDYVLVAVQDHGVPPSGVSALDFRHQVLKGIIEDSPFPHNFLFNSSSLPPYLARMKAVLTRSQAIPAQEYFIMDTGMAAILGASCDPGIKSYERILVLDIATSHTLGAALFRGEIMGFFEYHTSAISPNKLKNLIIALAEGNLSHREILEEGGHGAYIRKKLGFDNIEAIIATGPQRDMIKNLPFDIIYGAPLGDNMMTGTAGLLGALSQKKQLTLDL
jgi:uncharacterized protein (DUF1786 family)